MKLQPVLIDGRWQDSHSSGSFTAENPATRSPTGEAFPVSSWADCEAALAAAYIARSKLESVPRKQIAAFLEAYAEKLDAKGAEICAMGNLETALPVEPRLLQVELPRTTNQLRLAATAVREGSWQEATLDTANNIRSYLAPLGPVAIFGPNNFPLAFNGIAGGDFAAAIAAGNPVIAKANSSHPNTTQLLAQEALAAAQQTELPTGTVQMIYRTSHTDGEKLAADSRLGAIAYTGSRPAGLALKAAADAAGKPIYLELSSVNPLVLLPTAVETRGDALLDELVGSCLMGTGQFCTSPNLLFMFAGDSTEQFLQAFVERLREAPAGVLLSKGVLNNLGKAIADLCSAGAELLVGGHPAESEGYAFENTLLRVSGAQFVTNSTELQTEAFGNATTVVVLEDIEQALQVLSLIEGSLTASVYSAGDGSEDKLYDAVAPSLRCRVGRLLNDKMPTGVAVSPAMNHGGPFPSTGHPGFTAVGMPASLKRFAMLQCFDQVRPERLPSALQDANPTGQMWRSIDGAWTQSDVGS